MVTMASSAPAVAASGPLPLLRLAPEDAPASVLGLDSKDGQAGNKLTLALRKAFANRGLSGGEEISLEEMRLTMGCTNDGVACLADGGKTLGVRRLVFGYLAPSNSGYQLDIQILDVDAGELEAQVSMELSKSDLKDRTIDDTATRIVNELMPAQEADTDLPPRPDPLPEVDPDEEPEEPEEPPKQGSIYFGLEKPTPGWKWAGFGASLGLTVATAGVTIGTGVWLTAPDNASYGFRQKLLEAANATASKEDEFNRVPTTLPPQVNLCDYNSHEYTVTENNQYIQGAELIAPGGGPGARDSEVGNVCNQGKEIRTTMIAFGAATGVFGLSTLVFTAVLLVHKRKPKAEALLRHGLSLGMTPRPEGGFSFGGGLKF